MHPIASQIVDNVVSEIGEAKRRRTAALVLELDLTEPLVEGVPADPLSVVLARKKTSLRAVLRGLRRAAGDDRVRALVVRLGGSRSVVGLGQAQEIAVAVGELRDRGKVTVAWAETFGELHNATVSYFLASSFDEIWLQPSGDLWLTGIAAEVPFLRDALDKLGVTPQLAQRHEYKSAANLFTERQFTASHREATERVVHSMMAQIVDGIAANRGIAADDLRTLIDRAPLSATEARDAGLVDHLGYRDDLYAAVRRQVGADVVQQFVARYARRRPDLARRLGGADTVALVHVTGPIHLGPSGRHRVPAASAGSDTVIAALRAATKAPEVKSVVLRVASPGGSYVASDAIWHQVAATREAGKPVIVSMGDVAASGGYFVSMGADAIVAEPGTLTGSIGVVAGNLVVDGLATRLGIGRDAVQVGRHALMLSPFETFDAEQWDHFNAWLDRVYADFCAKVAAGRGLPAERVDDAARGRVWTGADARELGLVDELGGLEDAVRLAKERGGIPAAVDVDLRVFPRMTLGSRLKPAESMEDPAAAAARVGVGAWGPFATLAAGLGLPVFGPLTMPGEYLLTG